MAESIKSKLGFFVAAIMMVAALGALNIGSPADAQAQRCESDGGGGGGEQTPSPSPTETEEPFPPELPPVIPEETESESPSPTATEGGSRTCTSKITMNYSDPFRNDGERPKFKGKVSSPEDACKAGRKVIVKKKRKGRDQVFDTTVTNQKGSWNVPANRANGKYYAQTPKEKVPSDEGRVTCAADKSPTVKV